tara:strand:- start:124 stop:315 length:192 start_codon:yes stop_codon:yes gene_type:complete
MNIYESTGKKIESWPQWVGRLVKDNEKLLLRNRKLEEENLGLKRRCCELYEDLCEEKRKNERE